MFISFQIDSFFFTSILFNYLCLCNRNVTVLKLVLSSVVIMECTEIHYLIELDNMNEICSEMFFICSFCLFVVIVVNLTMALRLVDKSKVIES